MLAALLAFGAEADAQNRNRTRQGGIMGVEGSAMVRTIGGRVTLPDGSIPSGEVIIELVCRGRRVPVASLDSGGRFQFDADSRSTLTSSDSAVRGSDAARIEHGCTLEAALAGYLSTQALVRDPDAFERLDVGVLVLRPREQTAGNFVSVTSLQAPPKAKKAFKKAVKLMGGKRRNTKKAITELEKAVAAHPNYAEAWTMLGEARLAENDRTGARDALRRALTADPKFVRAYVPLLRIEMGAGRWDEAAMIAGNLVRLDPGDIQARFAHAVAHFNIDDLETAAESAQAVARSPQAASFPENCDLLGRIYAKQGRFNEAAKQYKLFLGARPEAPSAAKLRTRLSEWEALGIVDAAALGSP